MIPSPLIQKTNKRVYHCDGRFADVITFQFPASGLRLVDINQHNLQTRLKDIAHLRYVKNLSFGKKNPLVITFLRLEQDQPVKTIFRNIVATTSTGETLLSANSFITCTMRHLLSKGWLHYKKGTWHADAPQSAPNWQRNGEAVISLLTAQNRLHLEAGPAQPLPDESNFSGFDVDKALAAVDRCAFLSDVVTRQSPQIIFNTTYFLLEHDDFFSHHSALGEGYNLWVTDGQIMRPPLYRRGAIYQRQTGQWKIDLFGMHNVSLGLPNGLRLLHRNVPLLNTPGNTAIPFALNDEDPAEIMVYTRYYGVAGKGQVVGRTPVEAGRFELTVIDRRIVGWKTGGGLDIPQNGLVISFASGVLSNTAQNSLPAMLQTQLSITYKFVAPQHQDIVQAIQAGPILLQNGQSPLTNSYLEAEESFWSSRYLENGSRQIGVVPTDYTPDIDSTRHGRAGLGINEFGQLVLVMVAGINRGFEINGVDSDGTTLAELTNLLREEGAVHAVNLDGGGSAQAYYLGGRAVVPGDRRGIPQIHYERMVPSAGIVF